MLLDVYLQFGWEYWENFMNINARNIIMLFHHSLPFIQNHRDLYYRFLKTFYKKYIKHYYRVAWRCIVISKSTKYIPTRRMLKLHSLFTMALRKTKQKLNDMVILLGV